MFLAGVNAPKQLLHISFIGQVLAEELADGRENLTQLLAGLNPGFRVLSDLSLLESFGPGCAEQIGINMGIIGEKGVGLVVRVIPDESKDFGFNILSFFHYAHPPNTVTCCTMVEAAKVLQL
jgi:hypothetical protein